MNSLGWAQKGDGSAVDESATQSGFNRYDYITEQKLTNSPDVQIQIKHRQTLL